MTNLEKYNLAFCRTFDVAESDLRALQYESTAAWDSAGQAILVSEIEDAFDIIMAAEDIVNFKSYAAGLDILQKNYGVKFS